MRDGNPYPGKKLPRILVTPERREGAGEEVTSIVVTGRTGENERSADVLQIDGLISKICRLRHRSISSAFATMALNRASSCLCLRERNY